MNAVARENRHTRENPCRVCGGAVSDPQHQGVRCYGFDSDDGEWVYCTREEYATPETSFYPQASAYLHRARGACYCGESHDKNPARRPVPLRPADEPDWQPVATYEYTDDTGKIVAVKLRREAWVSGEHKKSFLWFRPDPEHDDAWLPRLGGMQVPLYKAAALARAREMSDAGFIYVTEGEKAAEKLIAAGLTATTGADGAGTWQLAWARQLAGLHVVLLPDHDTPGRQHAQRVARAIHGTAASVRVLRLDGLPEHGDVIDWLDAGHDADELGFKAQLAPRWTDPDTPEPVPTLTDDMLPPALRQWCRDIADRGSIPLEMVAIPAVVGFSGVAGNGLGIRPDRYSDYTCVPNLWGMVVARPGTMKSSAAREALLPVRRIDAALHGETECERADMAIKQELLDATIAGIRDSLRKAGKAGKDGETALGEEDRLRNAHADKAACVVPDRRVIVSDTTVERLGTLLHDNPHGLLLERDELTGLLTSLDKPGREGDRQFFLETWEGHGTVRVDRMGRPSVLVHNATLAIFGTIQPGRLAQYVADATSMSVRDDGLIQRFQLTVWPERPPPYEPPARPPDAQAREAVFKLFEWAATLHERELGQLDTLSDIPYVRFDAEAQERYDGWRVALENRLRSGELDGQPALAAHLGKYRSLMPSLALLFWLAESPTGGHVGVEHVELALRWCDYLERHAEKMYAGGNSGDSYRQRVLDALKVHGEMSKTDIRRNVFGKHISADKLAAVLDTMLDDGAITQRVEQTAGAPRHLYRLAGT